MSSAAVMIGTLRVIIHAVILKVKLSSNNQIKMVFIHIRLWLRAYLCLLAYIVLHEFRDNFPYFSIKLFVVCTH